MDQKINRFWNWGRNEDTGQRELWLEGVIAEESWWGDETTPALFKQELNSGDGPILLHISSPGGDCIAASQIYTMLMDYPYDVTVQIDGVAASAASVIAMAGTRVLMSPTALIMVHNPWTSAVGDAAEMQKAITMLDEVKESIINAYEIKTGLSRTRISHIMDSETWMNAKKALELGFCDEVLYEDGQEEADENTRPDFIFSSRQATRQLMNKVMASVPSVPIPDADHPPDEVSDVTAAPSMENAGCHDTALSSGEDAEANTGQPDTQEGERPPVNIQPDTASPASLLTAEEAVAGSLTISADQLKELVLSSATLPPVVIVTASPNHMPAPEKKEPDNRVKAADLEKRLSLLK